MKKLLITGLALFGGAFSAAAYCAPGEWWEVSSKMEMPGMPFAMPATTSRVCVAKGSENVPPMQDKECKMTNVKKSGSKTSWKVLCTSNGSVMNGTGEVTGNQDSYHGTMRISSTSNGETMNMTTAYKGKRVGPACNSSQP
ncbi:MAG: DUF3617 family protein [Nitrosomonadaceae bacterium]|nr:DUF3617 family protein [Nitrosomonadaceae bacterium]